MEKDFTTEPKKVPKSWVIYFFWKSLTSSGSYSSQEWFMPKRPWGKGGTSEPHTPSAPKCPVMKFPGALHSESVFDILETMEHRFFF